MVFLSRMDIKTIPGRPCGDVVDGTCRERGERSPLVMRLNTGDKDSLDLIRIRDQLHRVKEASPDVRVIYTMRKNRNEKEKSRI